jgi:hypothetical protein
VGAVALRTLVAAAAAVCALAVAEAFAPVAAVAFAPAAVAPVSLRGRRYRVPMLVRVLVATSRARLSAMPATDPWPLATRQERQGSM